MESIICDKVSTKLEILSFFLHMELLLPEAALNMQSKLMSVTHKQQALGNRLAHRNNYVVFRCPEVKRLYLAVTCYTRATN